MEVLERLTKNIGNKLSAKDVADYLGIDRRTVIKYHQQLGGVRLGRRYVFFEKEVVNAIQARREMGGPGKDQWKESGSENIFEEKRRKSVGGADRKRICRRPNRDASKYGLSD